MKENFGKYAIHPDEFLNEYHLDAYKLTNLDLFIYYYANFLVGKISQGYVQREELSDILFTFQDLKDLSMAIGRSLRRFLQKMCFGQCPLQCPVNLHHRVNLKKQLESVSGRSGRTVIQNLVQFLGEESRLENAFRVDLMNQVILDVLIDYYGTEFDTHLEEENLEIIELAEWIENLTIQFLQTIPRNYLLNREDSGTAEFRQVRHEVGENYPSGFYSGDDEEDEEHPDEPFSPEGDDGIEECLDAFERYIHSSSPQDAVLRAGRFSVFREYLLDIADLESIFDLSEMHLNDFMASWLISRMVFEDENRIQEIWKSVETFIDWLNSTYGLDLRKVYEEIYKRTRLSTRRAIRAINNFYSIHDQIENLILKSKFIEDTLYGWFVIEHIERLKNGYMDLRNIHSRERLPRIFVDGKVAIYLESGDLVEATFFKRTTSWELIELHMVLPPAARNQFHI